MSDQARQWVKQHSQHRGNAKFVLMMIADHCREGSLSCSVSAEVLADETGLSEKQVRRIVEALGASSELVIEPDKGPYGANLYHLPLVATSNLPDKMSTRTDTEMSGRNDQPDKMSGRIQQGGAVLPDILPDTMSSRGKSSGHSSGHFGNPPTPPNKVLKHKSNGDVSREDAAAVVEILRELGQTAKQRREILEKRTAPDGRLTLTATEAESWRPFLARPPDWCHSPEAFICQSLKSGDPVPAERTNGTSRRTNGYSRAGPAPSEVPDVTEAEAKRIGAAIKSEALKGLPANI